MKNNSIYGIRLGGGIAIIAAMALMLMAVACGSSEDPRIAALGAEIAAQNANIADLTIKASLLNDRLNDALFEIENMDYVSHSDIAALSADIDSLKDETAHSEEDLHALEDAIEEARKTETERFNELQSSIAKIQDDADTDDEAMSESNLRAIIADALAMEAADSDDAEILSELRTAIDELRSALADADSSAEIAALASRVNWLDRAIAPAYTQAYVEQAIRRYNTKGKQASLDYYNTIDSVDGELYLFVLDENYRIIVHPTVPSNIGLDIRGPLGTDITGKNFGVEFITATDAGKWVDYVYLNPAENFRHERKHSYLMKHEGLIFGSGWYERDLSLRDEPAAYTRAIVQEAISRYDSAGRDATVAYYNSPNSVDGQWYVFIIDEDDSVISHAPSPELLGADIKSIVGSNGYELGAEIAKATEAGHWVDYPWPNPALGGVEAPKHSWVIRHEGLIFGSGYYEE